MIPKINSDCIEGKKSFDSAGGGGLGPKRLVAILAPWIKVRPSPEFGLSHPEIADLAFVLRSAKNDPKAG